MTGRESLSAARRHLYSNHRRRWIRHLPDATFSALYTAIDKMHAECVREWWTRRHEGSSA